MSDHCIRYNSTSVAFVNQPLMPMPHVSSAACAFQAGIKASPSTMVPGIKILGLNVRFGVRNDVKMLPTFLRCFPNVETLHFVVLIHIVLTC